ncbi:alkaline shock response membrane anchor protein AmaP [Nocardiopsis sediminis]|uniref:Alkaline shock response membrane anchor protein AmaP n=1 Tax=Nocardiopsis sediminis TaxID=1778267 RepID=A0ABV8FU29_9ACTN
MTTVEDTVGRRAPGTVQRARRMAVHTFRPRLSWPATIAGLVLLSVAGVAAAEVISALAGPPMRTAVAAPAADYAATARWSDPSVQIASGVLALIGLVLIVVALLPGRSGRWTVLRTDDPALVVGVSKTALRCTLASAARRVGGVRSARVSVRRRRVRVRVRVHADLRDCAELRAEVAEAVQRRLSDLSPLYALTVSTRVRNAKVTNDVD